MSVAPDIPPRLVKRYGLRQVGGERSRLYRSRGLFDASAKDILALSDLDIRVVCDVRKPLEHNEHKPFAATGIHTVTFDFDLQGSPDGTSSYLPELRLEDEQPGERMLRVYTSLALNFGLVAHVVQVIRAAEGKVLMHCTNGKDRVGVLGAVLLYATGMEYEEVVADYLSTNEINAGVNQRDFTQQSPRLSEHARAVLLSLFEARREYLDTFFATVQQKYGSEEAIITQGLGLGEKDIVELGVMLGV
jgi:protein-tyrosine phosphatase